MKNLIKGAVRWWFDDPDHKGWIFLGLAVVFISILVGKATGSVLIGIFAIPIMYVGICCLALLSVGFGYALYLVGKAASTAYVRLRRWSIQETNDQY